MSNEEAPLEFSRMVRFYCYAWPKEAVSFVSCSFIDFWWFKLREFEMCDIRQALDHLTDSQQSLPPVAMVFQQAELCRDEREPNSGAREEETVAPQKNN